MSAKSKSRVSATPVDWSAIRRRVERITADITAGDDKTAEILARRAEALARPAETRVETAASTDWVVFELGGQTFAFDAQHVRETVLPRDLTRLPGLPEFIRGVVNVRSRIVAAVDLRPILQLDAATAAEGGTLLIVEFEGAEFGVLADRVLGLRTSADTLRRDVPGLDDRYLQGIASDGTLVLALPTLFPELVVDDTPES